MGMKGSDREKYSRVKSAAYIFALGAGTRTTLFVFTEKR
jgi:sulfite exporter TauE/SafE